MTKPSIEKILRTPELCEATGYRLTQVQKKIEEDPDFPKPVKLSKDGRAVGFLASEVAAYQRKRIAERDSELQKAKQQPRTVAAPAKPEKAKQQPRAVIAPAKKEKAVPR